MCRDAHLVSPFLAQATLLANKVGLRRAGGKLSFEHSMQLAATIAGLNQRHSRVEEAEEAEEIVWVVGLLPHTPELLDVLKLQACVGSTVFWPMGVHSESGSLSAARTLLQADPLDTFCAADPADVRSLYEEDQEAASDDEHIKHDIVIEDFLMAGDAVKQLAKKTAARRLTLEIRFEESK